MGLQEMPKVTDLGGGRKFWSADFGSFRAKVYVQKQQELADIVNFGYLAPYVLIFEEREMTPEEAVAFSDKEGYSAIAEGASGSVVFIYPASEKGWEDAPETLFADVIANSRIHQYFRDGIVTSKDRFTGKWGENYIRGAIFRTAVYGFGASADHIARHLLKTVNGQFLWGPGEITPACVILERLSVIPAPERRDIPVVSASNSAEVNDALQSACDHLLIKDVPEPEKDFRDFVWKYKRWVGILQENPDLEAMGLVQEPGALTVQTSPDNAGDDAGTEKHRIGYVAYYNRELADAKALPTLLAFHGGGDSAFYIAYESGWYRIAHKYGFLLISVENHLNSTATEMMELIDRLKEKYPIDETRLYASGFSMGGCKSWDLYQEYPERFAALAPMDATFEVGLNVYGQPAPKEINRTVPVPLFYAGGEETPLPELPFQAEKCWDRIRYVFEVNRLKTPYTAKFEERESWEERIWGIRGDEVEKTYDETRDSTLTVRYFRDETGTVTTALASISGQGHECRPHTCEAAWNFMKRFTRPAKSVRS
ncbi:MAG: hypothetical protein K6E92_11500 [Lachnospiraceae bacterium]|nr:hypothetical protein [Lachnospiraceae bacterium]